MYLRFVEKSHWKHEIINMSEGNAGGIKIATVELKVPTLTKLLKNESGVHRVQPCTCNRSRWKDSHSTATVAVLPVVAKVEIEIKTGRLKMGFF